MSDAENNVPEKKIPEIPESVRDNPNMDTVFHYSREHRLSRASAGVHQMNDGKPVRPSLSKTLFATRGHKLLFTVIIFTFVVFGFASRFAGKGMSVKLGGNKVVLAVASVEGTLVLEINKETPDSGEFYIGTVDIAVSAIMPKPKEGEERKENPSFTHRITFNPTESENFTLSLPFAGNDFFVILKTVDEAKSVRLRTKKN